MSTPQNPFADMYRLDQADSQRHNPFKARSTRRAPGNVPYVVDNLWEWSRPEGFPSRRHCVCASPSAALAKKLGGTSSGAVFTIKNLVGAKVAQIPQQDARYHPDATSLHKTLLKLLGLAWVGDDKNLDGMLAIAPLWMPALPRQNAEVLFKNNPRLAAIEPQLRAAIKFWGDAKVVSLSDPWPFPDGEIFFEAASWELSSACPDWQSQVLQTPQARKAITEGHLDFPGSEAFNDWNTLPFGQPCGCKEKLLACITDPESSPEVIAKALLHVGSSCCETTTLLVFAVYVSRDEWEGVWRLFQPAFEQLKKSVCIEVIIVSG